MLLFSIDISTVFSKSRGAGLTSTLAIVDGNQSLRRMSSIRRATFGSLGATATLKRKLTCVQIRFGVVSIILYHIVLIYCTCIMLYFFRMD